MLATGDGGTVIVGRPVGVIGPSGSGELGDTDAGVLVVSVALGVATGAPVSVIVTAGRPWSCSEPHEHTANAATAMSDTASLRDMGARLASPVTPCQ
jgi:hypothetical protein